MSTKFKLIIKADTNDADYIHSVHDVTTEELTELIPIFNAIKNFKPYTTGGHGKSRWTHDHNWPEGEYGYRPDLGEKSPEEIYSGVLTTDQIELFGEYKPSGSEGGIHDIVSISVLEYINQKEYL
jgi:hypothetical protein